MSLEAAAGKNPVSHVGKIYNVLAAQLAEAMVASFRHIVEARCLIVSKIGAPVSEPALISVQLATPEQLPLDQLRGPVKDLVADHLNRISELIRQMVAGNVDVF